ncbi:MAG: type I-E CRISPR-associated endoribonuclease Cas2 [Erysipelotrichaceae bacterium]|jgi:CRISPR-associated protein Cas2|nr:type I-E CRISPR-associated endoribonuclease Cas2 [Erysipelotrichaceae bacterium]
MPLTVITLSNVPKSLRGDLSKWMQEIATGVYIGNFNTKVREQLWERVKANIKEGEATISYYYRNEIGYKFDTINSKREIADFDGIPLVIFKELKDINEENMKLGFSKASKIRKSKKYKSINKNINNISYVVIDIETTGIDEKKDSIIELGALKYENSKISEFSCLISINDDIPKHIEELTGINNKKLKEKGVCLEEALERFLQFIGDLDLVGYNINFDINFLNNNLKKFSKNKIQNKRYDLQNYVKKEKLFLKNYKLETVIKEYEIKNRVAHRALLDCKVIFELSTKVIKFLDNYK